MENHVEIMKDQQRGMEEREIRSLILEVLHVKCLLDICVDPYILAVCVTDVMERMNLEVTSGIVVKGEKVLESSPFIKYLKPNGPCS
jgi:hypothetical protein